jgi:hypothetical protein
MYRGIAVFSADTVGLTSILVLNSSALHVESTTSGLAWFALLRGSDRVWTPLQGPIQIPERLIDVAVK